MVLIHSQVFFPLHIEMRACVLSHFSCIRLSATPWNVAHQSPLSMGFSWQENWCGLPCPPPGHLPSPGIEPVSPVFPILAGGFFITSTTQAAPLSRYYHTKSSKEKIIICSQPSSIPHSGFPAGSVGKEPAFSAGNTGDTCSIPGSGRSPGFPGGTSGKEPLCQCRRRKRRGLGSWVGKIPRGRAWQPVQYSCLENPMYRAAWQVTAHKAAQSRTR